MYYLDHCGSTPVSESVKKVLQESVAANDFGNPSAAHHDRGRRSLEHLEEARSKVAKILNTRPKNVIFTSGATEANNIALWGFYLRHRENGCQILYGSTEHKSILETVFLLKRLGSLQTYELPVDQDGILNLVRLEELLARSTHIPTLVVLMHVNNEIPVRHPVEQIGQLVKDCGAYFHCDGVQGFVRESVNLSASHWGSYVISSHKVYGPKGHGILAFSDHPISPLLLSPLRGGEQEGGIRPGTENTLAIPAGAAAICEHEEKRTARISHMKHCADIFINTLFEHGSNIHLTTPVREDAAGILNFYIDGLDSLSLLNAASDLCLNRGSSCLGGGGERYSHVPKALGLPLEIQANTIRASFGDGITRDESKEAAIKLAKIIASLI